jgi:hypothetical protein
MHLTIASNKTLKSSLATLPAIGAGVSQGMGEIALEPKEVQHYHRLQTKYLLSSQTSAWQLQPGLMPTVWALCRSTSLLRLANGFQSRPPAEVRWLPHSAHDQPWWTPP